MTWVPRRHRPTSWLAINQRMRVLTFVRETRELGFCMRSCKIMKRLYKKLKSNNDVINVPIRYFWFNLCAVLCCNKLINDQREITNLFVVFLFQCFTLWCFICLIFIFSYFIKESKHPWVISHWLLLKAHCTTCSYLCPLYNKKCLSQWPLVPHDPLFLMLTESWVDEINTCPVTLQGGLIPPVN